MTSIAPPAPDILGRISSAFRQHRHPVWNAAGEKVGSYETLDAMCQGQWYPYTGVARPPVSQRYVRDFWGRKVPLATQCGRAAQATAAGGSITQPQPVQAGSAVQAAQQAAEGANPEGFNFTWPGSVADDFGQPAPIDADQLQRWAIYGGLGLIGVLLLTSPGGRRR